MNIHEAVQAMADADARREGIMTLGEIRAALSKAAPTAPITISSGGNPGALDSYRGYYERLAIDPAEAPTTVAEFLGHLDAADGETFYGYKGGDYYMDADTYVHVAAHGCCGPAVVGVTVSDSAAVLVTGEVTA